MLNLIRIIITTIIVIRIRTIRIIISITITIIIRKIKTT